MKYEIAKTSRLGNRKSNQDRCLVLEAPDAVLLALADGMGGHPRGESAAQILMDASRRAFLTSRKPIANPRVFLSGLLDMAHHQILEFGQQQTPPIEPRTTGVLCLVQQGKAHWAHLGDSRLYVIRDGVIAFRTDDHSYVEHLRQQGLISSAQVHSHRFRNFVTRCLGGQNNHPVAELSEPFSLHEADIILLCSDGFWGPLPERTLVNALSDRAQSLATHLNSLAKRAESISKPESDNVTVVTLRWLQGAFDIDPADISMALTHNAAPHVQKTISEEHLQEAIDDLRRLLDEHRLRGVKGPMRPSGRRPDQLRPIQISRHYTKHAEGSVLIACGDTKVICTASVEETIPRWLKGQGQGWVTAEYGMLPRSTSERMGREASRGRQGGRTLEIQRLIGRSLRAAIDLKALGERTITLDCDVIQADGGTRTASITGACVALYDAIRRIRELGLIARDPLLDMVASVSVGIYHGAPVLDLDYAEDSKAETDMNVVMNAQGGFIEVQGTAEG